MKNLIVLVTLFVFGIALTATASVIKDLKVVKKEVVFDTTANVPIVFDVVADIGTIKLKPDVIRNEDEIKIVLVLKPDIKFTPDKFIHTKFNKRIDNLVKVKERTKLNKIPPKFNRTSFK
jgi:hypothetical protein